MSRSSGKSLHIFTKVYVPIFNEKGEVIKIDSSQKTIGDLKVGDIICDEYGNPTEVIHLNPIVFDEDYVITFEDDEKIICGPEHLWNISYGVVDTEFLYHVNKKEIIEILSYKDYPKRIKDIEKPGTRTPKRCITVSNKSGRFLIGDKLTATHNSFLSSPLVMARSLLFPSHNTYIMAPSGGQAQETFTKIENLAKNNIASVIGVSSFFLDETVRQNSKADPFVHDKNSYTVKLYNGSTINTLNSVAKNIVGIRSNFNLYDEAGKIDRDFFALTFPFTVQDTNFVTGKGVATDLYPLQLPNKNLLMSSAEGIDSELFDRYKLAFQRMLMGDPNYFVCDIDCSLSLHPFIDGKPTRPLVSQSTIDDAFNTNPYKATREYLNKFDSDGGQDNLCKRSTILRNSVAMTPIFRNEGGKKYIITYDPSSKIDNSIILVGELFRDEERGLMLKIVHCKNLIEILKSGEKVLKQKPEQIEMLKDIVLAFNEGAPDYDNIDYLILDAGAGGAGFDIGQYLMNEWKRGKKFHRGFIDPEDDYMKLRVDDYPGNATNLKMFNFKRDKVQAYERTQNAINQGLVIFPADLNARNEIEFEVEDAEGNISIRYDKASPEELDSLIQISLLKEELIMMQKTKKPNGTIQFDLSPEAQAKNAHDDRADCMAMMCNRLMELRAKEALEIETHDTGFKDYFGKAKKGKGVKKDNNPFSGIGGSNPLLS